MYQERTPYYIDGTPSANQGRYENESRFAVLQQDLAHFGLEVAREQVHQYLITKCGHEYDSDLFNQIIDLSVGKNDLVNIETFIDQFLETEETLNFRIQMNENKIRELVATKQQIQEQYLENAKGTGGQGHLLVQIEGASGLENAQNCQEIMGYATISFGSEFYKTKVIQGQNPKWNEAFDFLVLNPDLGLLAVSVHDHNRGGKGSDQYGLITFQMKDLQNLQIKIVNTNLTRHDGLNLKGKIQMTIKYIQSKENQYKQMEEKILIDIQNLQQENQESRVAIQQMNKILKLSDNKQNTTDYQTQDPKITVFKEIDLIDQRDSKIHPLEYEIMDKIENCTDSFIYDWVKVHLRLILLFSITAVLVNLYRNVLIDLTLVALFIVLLMENQMTQKLSRIITLGFGISFGLEIYWLLKYSGFWIKDSYNTKQEQPIKNFVNIMSYLLFFVRIPFTIVTWRHSIKYEEFQNRVDSILQNYKL